MNNSGALPPASTFRRPADHVGMRRLAVLTAALTVALVPTAQAAKLAPPKNKVYTGVTGSKSIAKFRHQVGKHPSVFGFFHTWNGPTGYIYDSVNRSGSRLMIHISTQDGYGTPEAVTPREIANGAGDRYLLRTNQEIADYGKPTYVRFLAEMNQTDNGYCAYNRDGSSRGRSHSTKAFKNAWRRATLILRGGAVADINLNLANLHLPPLNTRAVELPQPRVAMAWVPQTEGTPNIRKNSARAYWPGKRYVDWVGTDFYSKSPNFTDLKTFYNDFKGKPFVFGEWALWGADDPGFVHKLFDFVNSHKRVRMLLYNQGNLSGGPFRLTRYPRSREAIEAELAKKRFLGTP
jgi:hypothetical protein